MKARDVLGALVGRTRILLVLGALVALALPASAVAAPPQLTIGPVTDESLVTAKVSGTVDADGIFSEWWFEVSTEGGEFVRSSVGGTVEGSDPESVSGTLQGLAAGKSHEVRLAALNYEEFVTETSEAKAFSTDPAVAPALTLDPAADVTSGGAHLAGTIDPEGGNTDPEAGLLAISWELQINRENPQTSELEGWNTVGSEEWTDARAEADDPIGVEADATGLQPNSHYRYRLLVRYAGLEAEAPEGGAAAFDTGAVKPDVARETLWNPTRTSIQLNAKVNPHNAQLGDCHFEYGVGGDLDQSAPCERQLPGGGSFTLPGNEGFSGVAARIGGLSPGTEYGFRLVATNSAGTTEGEVRSFTTLAEPEPESCPNQEIRDFQHTTFLPDCRAYEKVSPSKKSIGDIVGFSNTNFASIDGNGLTFSTLTPFGDTIGSGIVGQTMYLARRAGDGWSSHAITPVPRHDAYQTFVGTRMQAFSGDLSRTVLRGFDLPAASDDIPLHNNLYVEETSSRTLQTVTMKQNGLPDPSPFLANEQFVETDWGTSADARHVAFVSRASYLPVIKQLREAEPPEQGPSAPNIYQWDDGVLSLAGILPDGSVATAGSDAAAQNLFGYRAAMSEDGSRLLFRASAGGPKQLYQRVNGEETVWVSRPEVDPADPNLPPGYQPEPADVTLQAASPSGHAVFFSTSSPLLSDDTNEAGDLYRWTAEPDVSSGKHLTRITSGGFGGEVIGMSDDAERIYYQSGGNIIFWAHGAGRVIASGAFGGFLLGERPPGVMFSPGMARVTPDGRYLAFLTNAQDGDPPVGPAGDLIGSDGPPAQMYLYSLDNDTLDCISCPPGVAKNNTSVVNGASVGIVPHNPKQFRPRYLSHGGAVSFSTAEALVPDDSNGEVDSYRYDPVTGSLGLLSTGRGAAPTTFVAADPDGDNVFLATRQRLVPSDTDELVDVYDVRIGGGFPETIPAVPPLPCRSDGCQPPVSMPAPSTPAASAAAGRGNVKQQRRRCGRRAASASRRTKQRCAKKPHKQRRAHHDRGAGR